MKYFSSKFYLRLITFSLLISAVPVIFIGLFSYYSASRMIQKKVDDGNAQILLQTQMRVEQALKMSENSILQLLMYIHGVSLNRNSFSYNKLVIPDDYSAVNDMVVILNNLGNDSIRLEDAALVFIEREDVISTRGYAKLSDMPQKPQFSRFAASLQYSFWSRWSGPLISSLAQYDNAAGAGIILMRKMLPLGTQNTNVIAVVKISGRELSKFITGNSELGEIMILDEHFNVIADKNAEMLGKDLSSSVYAKKIAAPAEISGRFVAKMEDKTMQISYLRSDYNGWVYISTVPVASITSDSRAIGWASFLSCLVSIVLIVIVSLQGSKRIYSPFYRVYESVLGETEKGGGARSKDEFKYLYEHIPKLMHERKQLASQLEFQTEQYREYYIIKMFLGEVRTEEIEQKLHSFGSKADWKHMCVLLLEVETLEGTPFYEEDMELVKFAVSNIICELVQPENRLNPVSLQHRFAILLGSDHDLEEAFKSFVFSQGMMIQTKIKDCLHITVSLGISRPFQRWDAVRKAYLQSLEALKHKLYLGNDAIIFFEEIKSMENTNRSFPKKLEEELLYAVKLSDADRADKMLTAFIREIFQGKLSYLEYQISIGRLLMDLIRIMQELDIPAEKLFGKESALLDKLSELKNQKAVEQWFCQSVIHPMIKIIEEHRALQYKKISDEIIDMIHEQYDKDLTLELCAQRMNYNSKHLSRVFKEETGVCFSDYLARYRMEIAKMLLSNTNMKISDIAEKLKYQNAQNFIRYFRKIEGRTPGQYRGSGESSV